MTGIGLLGLPNTESENATVDVTVAVMSYNNSSFLAQTIDSILAQEGVRFEVVVYDDCSQDDSLAVLQRYVDEPLLRFEVNAQNLGMAGNYNKCVAAGQGRYVVVLGSDDILYPGHLASLVEAMDACPQAALGYTQCYWIDEKGVRQQYADHPGHRRASYAGGRDEVIDLLCFDNYITPSAAILRRSALHQVELPEGGIHRHDMLAGDWELWIRLASMAPDFVFLRQPSVGYRVHGGQISKSFYGSDRPLREHTEILEMCLGDASIRSRMQAAAQPIWQLYHRRVGAYAPEARAQLQVRIDAIRRALLEPNPQDSVASCLFSIILTTYNRPGLLKDALASVGKQDLRDFEVILVNDNGDPVESLLEAHDFPITYLRQGRNQGLSAARNAGLKLARGRYVVYLDDDDIYLPNHLAVLAEAFQKHPDSVVYTGVEYVSEKLEGESRIELGRDQPFKHEMFDCDRLFVQNFIPVNTWAHPLKMLAAVGDFDVTLSAFEDWDMLMRLAARYPFVHVPVITTEVHIRAQSASGDHMLGRERKNFPALYREMYSRHAGSGSAALIQHRAEMLKRMGGGESVQSSGDMMRAWLAARSPSSVQQHIIERHLLDHQGGPCFGVLVLDPEGNTEAVARTLNSLQEGQQGYRNIQTHIFTSGELAAGSFGANVVSRVEIESLAQTLNKVLSQQDFDWCLLVRAGECLTHSGLLVAALELLVAPECRALYFDEVQLTEQGDPLPILRPDFNLDLLLSFPGSMGRHWMFRREVLLAAGGFDHEYANALEFDLVLRLIEEGGLNGLGHIAEPLLVGEALALVDNADEQRALIRHLKTRGYSQPIIDVPMPGRYRILYGHEGHPGVSIVIDATGSLAKLQRCMESVLETIQGIPFEVILLKRSEQGAEVETWLEGLKQLGEDTLRVVDMPTGTARLVAQNQAAGLARGDYLLFLAPDAAAIQPGWLQALLNHAQRPEVGMVGAKLLSPDGTLRHAGLVLGLKGDFASPFEGDALDAAGYMNRLEVDQNYSAVSGDCLIIARQVFEQLSGFDEAENVSAWADVDLCLRARQAGYLTVWTPHATLMKEGEREPLTREAQDELFARWLPVLARDPAYNPNLSLQRPGGFKLTDIQLSWRPLASWRPVPAVLAHPADQYGCGHYRVMQPFMAMERAGMLDGTLSSGLMHVVDLERYDPDVIVLQRQIGEERLEAMRRMQAFSRAFKVYELDDYLPNLPMKSQHRERMPKDILKSLRRGLSYVDRFVVSTQPLAEALSGLHADIQVVENRLPLTWWKDLPVLSSHKARVKPRVGWAGGVSHRGDLEMIKDVIIELADEVDWVFFGMCPASIRPYVKEFHEGVAIEHYPAALARLDLDLALAPVEQNLFNECKSNLRLLEYGACGYPVICSDVRCYQGALPVTRVKNRYRDWVDAIRMHLSDPVANAAAGQALREVVQRDWMLDGVHLENWLRAWSGN